MLGGELFEEPELMELARSRVGSPLTLGTLLLNESLRFVRVLLLRFLGKPSLVGAVLLVVKKGSQV